MRHRKHTFRVGRSQGHRRALLRNLARSLIREGRIVTTVTKAREARRLAEKLITLAKDGSLHARRRAIAMLGDADTVHYLFEERAAEFEGRQGGYTRILRLDRRRGDAAEMVLLELVEPLGGAESEETEGGEAAGAAEAAEAGPSDGESSENSD